MNPPLIAVRGMSTTPDPFGYLSSHPQDIWLFYQGDWQVPPSQAAKNPSAPNHRSTTQHVRRDLASSGGQHVENGVVAFDEVVKQRSCGMTTDQKIPGSAD